MEEKNLFDYIDGVNLKDEEKKRLISTVENYEKKPALSLVGKNFLALGAAAAVISLLCVGGWFALRNADGADLDLTVGGNDDLTNDVSKETNLNKDALMEELNETFDGNFKVDWVQTGMPIETPDIEDNTAFYIDQIQTQVYDVEEPPAITIAPSIPSRPDVELGVFESLSRDDVEELDARLDKMIRLRVNTDNWQPNVIPYCSAYYEIQSIILLRRWSFDAPADYEIPDISWEKWNELMKELSAFEEKLYNLEIKQLDNNDIWRKLEDWRNYSLFGVLPWLEVDWNDTVKVKNAYGYEVEYMKIIGDVDEIRSKDGAVLDMFFTTNCDYSSSVKSYKDYLYNGANAVEIDGVFYHDGLPRNDLGYVYYVIDQPDENTMWVLGASTSELFKFVRDDGVIWKIDVIRPKTDFVSISQDENGDWSFNKG